MRRTIILTFCFVLSLAGGILRAQSPTLAVTGAVPTPVAMSAGDLAQLPRQTVSTTSNGITTEYEGVWLSDLLSKAGLVFGPRARGASLSTVVVAVAEDGYQVAFSIGEVDPGITEGRYLVADKANGQMLFGENGSFRLIVPGDKRGARSVRMLKALRVISIPQQ